MKIRVSHLGERGTGREGEQRREPTEAGGRVSVQFTNTTVNSEAGQGRVRALGGVKERLLNQEIHRNETDTKENVSRSIFRSSAELTYALFTC